MTDRVVSGGVRALIASYYALLESKMTADEFYAAITRLIIALPYFFAPHIETLDYLRSLELEQEYASLLDFSYRQIVELFSREALWRGMEAVLTKRDTEPMLEILCRAAAARRGGAFRRAYTTYRVRQFRARLPDAPTIPERNLKLIKRVAVRGMQEEVAVNEICWTANRKRQESFLVHSETNAIILRQLPPETKAFSPLDGPHQSSRTTFAQLFPTTTDFVEAFARENGAGLGRVAIVRLKPRSMVYRHWDSDACLQGRKRYHLVISSPEGSLMTSGAEKKRFSEGDLFFFENHVMHTAENDADAWRIHVIFDMVER